MYVSISEFGLSLSLSQILEIERDGGVCVSARELRGG